MDGLLFIVEKALDLKLEILRPSPVVRLNSCVILIVFFFLLTSFSSTVKRGNKGKSYLWYYLTLLSLLLYGLPFYCLPLHWKYSAQLSFAFSWILINFEITNSKWCLQTNQMNFNWIVMTPSEFPIAKKKQGRCYISFSVRQ